MSESTFHDETGTVEVVLAGTRVDAVRISNRWRDRFDTEQLAEALSIVIRDALPRPEPTTPPQPTGPKHLPLANAQAFIAALREGRAASRRYVARLKAGQVERPPLETRHVDQQERIEVSLIGGRFQAVYINPEWADKAPIQTLCDALLAALDVPLIEDRPQDPDMAEAQRHYAEARRYLVDK